MCGKEYCQCSGGTRTSDGVIILLLCAKYRNNRPYSHTSELMRFSARRRTQALPVARVVIGGIICRIIKCIMYLTVPTDDLTFANPSKSRK